MKKNRSLVGLALLLFPMLVGASGVAPTGCALVLERTSNASLVAKDYATEPGVTNFLLTKEQCATKLQTMATQPGDQLTLDQYEQDYLVGVSIGDWVAIPVDQVWSSPGPNGEGGGNNFILDYFGAWDVSMNSANETSIPPPARQELMEVEPVDVVEVKTTNNIVEVPAEVTQVKPEAVMEETSVEAWQPTGVVHQPPRDLGEVPRVADDSPPTTFTDSMLFGWVYRFVSWLVWW